jgi:hypothetical protein
VPDFDEFAFLLAPHPPAGPGAVDDDQLEAACRFLLREWQILPAALPVLLAWAGTRANGHPAVQRVRDRDAGLRLFGRIQFRVCMRLAGLLARRGIPYVLLKGSAARVTVYADLEDRCGKDIDIAVPARYLRQAQRAAREVGFVESQWNPGTKRFTPADPVLRARVEARHYELGFYARHQRVSDVPPADEAAIRRDIPHQYLWHTTAGDQLACYTTVDIHHGLNLDIPVDDVVRTARSIVRDGQPLSVPAPEWSVLFLIFKIYWEGTHTYRKGLYQFADLARHVAAFTDDDFTALRGLLAAYQLEVPAFYVLRRLESDLGVPLPASMGDALDALACTPDEEDVDAMAFNDFGDMWPKMWGQR